MKKTSILCFELLLAMIGLVLGCNRQKAPETPVLPSDIKDYDMVMLNEGQLFFYNTETAVLTNLQAEKDSVVNACFESDIVYYCVAKDNHILLRCIDLSQPNPQPKQLVDWGVPYDDCVTETYGTVSPLYYYPGRNTLGLNHAFSWDGYWFTEEKLYNLETGEIADWNWEWEEEGYETQPISTADGLREYLIQTEGQYYMTDGNDGNYVCLTDQIDFNNYLSDPDYATDIEFEYISSSPDNLKVLYMAILEWGDFPHGILAVSSIDGKIQIPLEDTDCTGFTANWLKDGSLVYVGEEPVSPEDPDYEESWHYLPHCIKRIYPDGHTEIIAHCGEFVMKQSVVH